MAPIRSGARITTSKKAPGRGIVRTCKLSPKANGKKGGEDGDETGPGRTAAGGAGGVSETGPQGEGADGGLLGEGDGIQPPARRFIPPSCALSANGRTPSPDGTMLKCSSPSSSASAFASRIEEATHEIPYTSSATPRAGGASPEPASAALANPAASPPHAAAPNLRTPSGGRSSPHSPASILPR